MTPIVGRIEGRLRAAFVLAGALACGGCAQLDVRRDVVPGDASVALRFIGERVIEHRLAFGGTVVGGLSGIDYDPRRDLYVMVSDDRSSFSPARFYLATLAFDADRFHDATLLSTVVLRRPDGRAFDAAGSDREVADAEAIRFDPRRGTVWWASEGLRRVGVDARADRFVDPFVREATLDGRHVSTLPLDPMFRMRRSDPDGRGHGPRDNRGFEGLTLSPDGGSLWVALEGPRYEDGPMSTRAHGAWTRISRFDRSGSEPFESMSGQYAYRIDAIPDRFALAPSHSLNSISEILALDDHRLLVLERALVVGSGWFARLYEADTARATDVRSIDALEGVASLRRFEPMSKRLVLDFATLPVAIDNLEGVSFGPTLANGHRSLVFVSDDNFNPGEKTQLLVFEMLANDR